ncbi:hypothetical protein K435DRAFT_840527 [Dendrothele bispora CBS 962.96]|uniref:Uncharacterized protein n=1 Tax=Dendrothele bispora (strain CBS 962.96) TaxID=1314807 RepID=A0A4S8LTF0_DENBC|nr:hypothetical protein K435DRAFT_840527 [Dendrothele bispora CBS 962.96]
MSKVFTLIKESPELGGKILDEGRYKQLLDLYPFDQSSDKNKNKKDPSRIPERLGQGKYVEDELEQNRKRTTKEVIKPLTYRGIGRLGLLPALRLCFDLQFQLEFTLHRRTKGSPMCLMYLRGWTLEASLVRDYCGPIASTVHKSYGSPRRRKCGKGHQFQTLTTQFKLPKIKTPTNNPHPAALIQLPVAIT